MKAKATFNDVYAHISTSTWKTLFDIKEELEAEGKGANHMKGYNYIRFDEWENRGLIISRKRHVEYPGINFKETPMLTEYLRIPDGKRADERHSESGLAGQLSPVSA